MMKKNILSLSLLLAFSPSLMMGQAYLWRYSLVKPTQSETLSYEDAFIYISFVVAEKEIKIDVNNKTESGIKISWDDLSLIYPDGKSTRIIHSGIRLIDRNIPQATSMIPPHARISDILIPSDKINNNLGGGNVEPIFGGEDRLIWNDKEFSIYFPLEIGGNKKEYNFGFKVNISLSAPAQEPEKEKLVPVLNKPKTEFGIGVLEQSKIHFGIDAGITMLTADDGKVWNMGFFLSGNFSFPLNPNLLLGLQASYHRWTPDIEGLKREAGVGDEYDVEATGGMTHFEIMPYLHLPIFKKEGTEVFVQGGGGVTFLALKTKLRVSYGYLSLSDEISDSDTRPGIFFTLGVRLGKIGKIRYQATVQYHNVFVKGGNTGYVAFGVGCFF